jgi:hypothetical protein
MTVFSLWRRESEVIKFNSFETAGSMRKGLQAVIFLSFVGGSALPASAAEILYTSSQSFGGKSPDLSILTDGTFGTLTSLNILRVSVFLSDGQTGGELFRDLRTNEGNASFFLSSPLSASLQYLKLRFILDATNNEFGLYTPNFLYFYGAGKGSVFSSNYAQTIRFAGINTSTPLAGDFILGVNEAAVQVPAVPEPATWAMLIMGFGVVGVAMRRAVRSVRISHS